MGTGKDMFYSLMNRIKSDGIDVNRIRGSWYSDTGSVNYETFKSLLDGGVGSESAATLWNFMGKNFIKLYGTYMDTPSMPRIR
jgi:hypothetical protein